MWWIAWNSISVRECNRERKKTSKQNCTKLSQRGFSVSARTVRWCLLRVGMLACRLLKKQKLTKLMKAERYNWAKKFQIWTVEDCKRISNQCTPISNIRKIKVRSVMTVFGTGRLHIIQGNIWTSSSELQNNTGKASDSSAEWVGQPERLVWKL